MKDSDGGTLDLSYQEMLKKFKSGAISGDQLAKYGHGGDWLPVHEIVAWHNEYTKKFIKVSGIIVVIFIATVLGYLTYGDSFQPIGILVFNLLIAAGGCFTYAIGKQMFFLGYTVFFGMLLMDRHEAMFNTVVMLAGFYTFGGIIQSRLSNGKRPVIESSSDAKQK